MTFKTASSRWNSISACFLFVPELLEFVRETPREDYEIQQFALNDRHFAKAIRKS